MNALSEYFEIKLFKKSKAWRQTYVSGIPTSKLKSIQSTNKTGTFIKFIPDKSIFEKNITFDPIKLYELSKSKAFLYKGVKIKWSLEGFKRLDIPHSEIFYFPNGLVEYIGETTSNEEMFINNHFFDEVKLEDESVEWCLNWFKQTNGKTFSYCNTVFTSEGGTHEQALKNTILKAIKSYGKMIKIKNIDNLNTDDCCHNLIGAISIFIKSPQFQGQTKNKLTNKGISKLIENAIKDRMEIWLSQHSNLSKDLIDYFIIRMTERIRKKKQLEIRRKSFTQKVVLPGKLSDCSSNLSIGTELFIVEGDSAGGSAKQARYRENQAILALRGKILNVASSTFDKLNNSKELNDVILTLGCGTRNDFDINKLRYERIILMTDADVDGAHITSLLLTFFLQEMPQLIELNKIYIAQPPLYRISDGKNIFYAKNDVHKEKIIEKIKNKTNFKISRFKGLGEMPAEQLKSTTMDPKYRTLIKVNLNSDDKTNTLEFVNDIMGKNPEKRLSFIQKNAQFSKRIDL